MFGQFLSYLVLATMVSLGLICGLFFLAYRHRQARRSAPPMLWGLDHSNDFIHGHPASSAPRRGLIATIGYADGSKLVTRN